MTEGAGRLFYNLRPKGATTTLGPKGRQPSPLNLLNLLNPLNLHTEGVSNEPPHCRRAHKSIDI